MEATDDRGGGNVAAKTRMDSNLRASLRLGFKNKVGDVIGDLTGLLDLMVR